jgi:hypothetical protein
MTDPRETPPRSGRTYEEEPTASPVTACRRCRKQKVSNRFYYLSIET